LAFLFSDIENSTALWERHPDAMGTVMARHDQLMAEVVSLGGGRLVKTTGDGMLASFITAGAAVRAAITAQKMVAAEPWPNRIPLRIRMGIHVGSSDERDGDFYGSTLNRAARVMALAHGEQVVVSDLAQRLARREVAADIEFVALGVHVLRGIPEPEPIYQVAADGIRRQFPPITSGASAVAPSDVVARGLPNRLAASAQGPFVGRIAQLASIETAFQECQQAMRRIVLISGEPGVGKTALVARAATIAHQRGATVLYGRCDEDLAIPYQPFVEALNRLVQVSSTEVLNAHVQRHGTGLGRLLPELARRLTSPLEDDSARSATERQLLFESIIGLLGYASELAPVVMVLDDLQWADKPSVLLLKQLAQSDDPMRLLIIGAYRDTDLTVEHHLTSILADLRRETGVYRVPVDGFDEDETTAFIEALSGQKLDKPGRDLIDAVRRDTGGNAFFTGEVFRHLSDSGAVVQGADGRWRIRQSMGEVGLPDSVREVVSRRVARLGEPTQRALTTAAIIGRDFDLDLLTDVVGGDENALLDAVDRACAADLIREVAGALDRYTFSHALVQQTLAEALSASRRRRLHQAVAVALEQRFAGDERRIGELATHWMAGAQAGDLEKALHYANRAGTHALNQLAPDEALRWFGEGLALLDRVDQFEPLRVELLIGLGIAQRDLADQGFRSTLLSAARRAQQSGDQQNLVRAVMANTRGTYAAPGEVDGERVDALNLALGATTDPASRAQLLALLAVELTFGSSLARRFELTEEAVELARKSTNPDVLARVLSLTISSIAHPATNSLRAALTGELLDLTASAKDPLLRVTTLRQRATVCLQALDVPEAHAMIDLATEAATRSHQPDVRFTAANLQAARLLAASRYEQAQELLTAASQAAAAHGIPEAEMAVRQMAEVVWRERGELASVVDLVYAMVGQGPTHMRVIGFALAARAFAQVDRIDDVVRILREAPAAPEHESWSWITSQLAEAAAAVGDRDRAQRYFEELRPFAAQLVVEGNLVSYGPVAHYLGLTADAIGRPDDADHYFALALDNATKAQLPYWVAETMTVWATRIVRRTEAGARGAPDWRALAKDGAQRAQEHGFGTVRQRAEALLGEHA
jgi:class 3 adenylate cyclase/tetratricopeptide (TPR) repeat protein